MSTAGILVADSDTAFVDALEIYLNDQGFSVMRASSGHRALTNAIRYPIHLAIIDLRLPDMDGLDAAGRIRHSQPNVPIILISSEYSPKVLRGCSLAKPYCFMAKPISPDELMERIVDMLSRKACPNPFALAAQ